MRRQDKIEPGPRELAAGVSRLLMTYLATTISKAGQHLCELSLFRPPRVVVAVHHQHRGGDCLELRIRPVPRSGVF
jgi:hypothetical protein